MKKKIRCIYIDGMEKSGKTSVAREIRMFLKNKNKDLYDIDGSNDKNTEMQDSILSENEYSFILKENSVLSDFYKDLKENKGLLHIIENYSEVIRKEKSINHSYGAVHFFLLPSMGKMSELFEGKIPLGIRSMWDFYNGINQYTITQGLDIKLISFDEFDKIYDVRDKILEALESEYLL